MRKRGANFRNRNAMIPGLIAQAACSEYETRLRLAVDSLRDGWMDENQFNDLADTMDMLQIGMASYSKQKPDPSTEVAIEICREALMSVRNRYLERGKLLAEVSLDYWSRRSGALFAFSCQKLRELRKEQQLEFAKGKEVP